VGIHGGYAKHGLLAAEETLQQICDTISDKAEKIVEYENAPALTTSTGTFGLV